MVSCSVIFERIWLLVWKNFLLRRRHYIVTSCEIVLPLFCNLFLFVVHHIGGESDAESREFHNQQRDPSIQRYRESGNEPGHANRPPYEESPSRNYDDERRNSNVPEYREDILLLLPIFLTVGFIFIVPAIIPAAVSEKRSGIKELMKIMGLPNWIQWFGWMIPSLLILTITNLIILLLLYASSGYGAIMFRGSASVCFFALFLWSISAISFCFFLSVIFPKPTLATAAGFILWLFLSFGIGLILLLYTKTISFSLKMAAALLPQASLCLALTVMADFEKEGSGAKWKNFAKSPNVEDRLTIAHMYLMFIVDAIFYMLLTVYLENVLPSEFGLRKPWYYIFLASSWSDKKVAPMKEEVVELGRPGFEAEAEGLVAGIVIKGLTKRFGRMNAVDGVSLKMYQGEITALLGHNGAGKTTTMSMLTGLFAPTSGTAIVNGYDIRTSMDQVRTSLGLCPQHNMLFDDLTVQEHLIFFGMLKGLSKSAAKLETSTMLGRLQLSDKQFALSSKLSGGQKRKLSLGIALIGGTKVVVLDEPTSGMDPEARRAVWDLLLEMRGDRTILLTTHYMEEADVLGDKIAIMAAGKVKCYGTPLFLKHFYGAGYTLKITTTNNSNADADAVLQAVQKNIPAAYYKAQRSSNSAEISIVLPNEDDTKLFPGMFTELEGRKGEFGIQTVGLTQTTMDEVFVRVGELQEEENRIANIKSRGDTNVMIQHDSLITEDERWDQLWYFHNFGDFSLNDVCVIGEDMDLFSHKLVTQFLIYKLANKKINFLVGQLKRGYFTVLGWAIDVMVVPVLLLIGAIVLSGALEVEFRDRGEGLYFASIVFSVGIPFSLSLLPAVFAIFPKEEKLSKAKQLQLMTGVSPLIYWGSSIIWDFIVVLIVTCLMLTCFPIFQPGGVGGVFIPDVKAAGTVFLIITVYGYSAIPFSYVAALWMKTTTRAVSFVFMTLLGGVILQAMTAFMEPFLTDEVNIATGFVYSFRIIGFFIPTFGAGLSIGKYFKIVGSYAYGTFAAPSYLTWAYPKNSNIYGESGRGREPPFKPGTGLELLLLWIIGTLYYVLLFLIEYGIITFSVYDDDAGAAFLPPARDEDIAEENMRIEGLVNEGRIQEDALVVHNISKNYGPFAAVSNLTFGVHFGECFGLLGVNGAGKTTCFRMLTGDEVPSSGNAFTLMHDLRQNPKLFIRNIGYCPQFDALIGVLTGRETLQMFCRLRGVSKIQADYWLHKMGLEENGRVQCRNYSGGMKRRLSAAIAMIGDSPLILLDEPTAGVDPIARRQFWDVIKSARDSGQAVILTSHNMDECEALCARLGIMVNGQLQCFGGVQHLKSKFAQGFSLTIKLKPIQDTNPEDLLKLNTEIANRFSPCLLKDQHANLLQYQLLNTSMPWGLLFQNMEDLKEEFATLMEEYSVTESTLEDVFLSFARDQYPERALAGIGCCCCCF